MLKTIFDLLKTWNDPHVGNFFVLLKQFIDTYSCPLLHDGTEKLWELPYSTEQVNIQFCSTTDHIHV